MALPQFQGILRKQLDVGGPLLRINLDSWGCRQVGCLPLALHDVRSDMYKTTSRYLSGSLLANALGQILSCILKEGVQPEAPTTPWPRYRGLHTRLVWDFGIFTTWELFQMGPFKGSAVDTHAHICMYMCTCVYMYPPPFVVALT